MNDTKLRILLCGYYGFGNYGDEALRHTAQDLIRNVLSEKTEYRIEILCRKVSTDKKALEGRSISGAAKQVFCSDVLIFGGGGIFQNQSSSRSLLFYAGLIALAKLLGKKIILLGMDFIPLRGFFAPFLIFWLLKNVPVSVRSRKSQTLARIFGLSPVLASDLLYLTQLQPPAAEKETCDRHILVSIRKNAPGISKGYFEKLLPVLKMRGFKISGLALTSEDHRTLRAVFRKSSVTPENMILMEKNPFEFLACYHRPSLVIGCRLHSLITASLYEIPFVMAGSDPKLKAFVKESGFPILSDNPEAAADVINDMFNRYDFWEAETRQQKSVLSQRCRQNVNILIQHLSDIRP